MEIFVTFFGPCGSSASVTRQNSFQMFLPEPHGEMLWVLGFMRPAFFNNSKYNKVIFDADGYNLRLVPFACNFATFRCVPLAKMFENFFVPWYVAAPLLSLCKTVSKCICRSHIGKWSDIFFPSSHGVESQTVWCHLTFLLSAMQFMAGGSRGT